MCSKVFTFIRPPHSTDHFHYTYISPMPLIRLNFLLYSNGIPPSVSKRYDVQVNCKYIIPIHHFVPLPFHTPRHLWRHRAFSVLHFYWFWDVWHFFSVTNCTHRIQAKSSRTIQFSCSVSTLSSRRDSFVAVTNRRPKKTGWQKAMRIPILLFHLGWAPFSGQTAMNER